VTYVTLVVAYGLPSLTPHHHPSWDLKIPLHPSPPPSIQAALRHLRLLSLILDPDSETCPALEKRREGGDPSHSLQTKKEEHTKQNPRHHARSLLPFWATLCHPTTVSRTFDQVNIPVRVLGQIRLKQQVSRLGPLNSLVHVSLPLGSFRANKANNTSSTNLFHFSRNNCRATHYQQKYIYIHQKKKYF